VKAESVPIDSVHPDPANVRIHPERNLAGIKASLARFGQQRPILVDASGIIRAGNGTHAAAMELGWDTIAIVRTTLKGSEATAYAIADNRTAELAEWDDTALADTLRALQSEDFDLDAVGYTGDEVDALIERLGSELLPGDDAPEGLAENYTRKIEAPIYKPTGERPAITDLFDNRKTAELVQEIEAADLPADLAVFLKLAAERHTVFHFRNIAEFYAHADRPTQDLMERSALVIIDFDKAIANGFVHMTERLMSLADSETEGGDDA
jgi:hypothetical protein